MLGPLYIKSTGTGGTKMSAKGRPHHNGDKCTRENNWKSVFDIWAKMWEIMLFWLFEGPWGALNYLTLSTLLSGYPSHPYPCNKGSNIHAIRKQSEKNILVQIQNMKNIFFLYLGGPGGALRRTQGYQIFRTVRPHHIADKYITRGKIIKSCSYMGPNIIFFFNIRGGGGWVAAITGRTLLPSYPLT